MAVWRRKALAIFPELATELNEPNYTIYQLFFDLTPMAEQGHRNRDSDLRGKIYGFVENFASPISAFIGHWRKLFEPPSPKRQGAGGSR